MSNVVIELNTADASKEKMLSLDMNDGSILTHIVRYKPNNIVQQRKLIGMLSPDGKLVARALLGKSKNKLSANVLTTAKGLESWAGQIGKSRTSIRRRERIKELERKMAQDE